MCLFARKRKGKPNRKRLTRVAKLPVIPQVNGSDCETELSQILISCSIDVLIK